MTNFFSGGSTNCVCPWKVKMIDDDFLLINKLQ